MHGCKDACMVAYASSSTGLGNACMRLSMVPSIRSRRVVSNAGPHLSVACDLTSFIPLVGLYKLWLQNPRMRLSMVPSIRSRRVVSNGGPHLSVACL